MTQNLKKIEKLEDQFLKVLNKINRNPASTFKIQKSTTINETINHNVLNFNQFHSNFSN
jgi:methyl coenzyme M reductase subunit C-like uncharacterized protein (methanogenesis marker protein 7)